MATLKLLVGLLVVSFVLFQCLATGKKVYVFKLAFVFFKYNFFPLTAWYVQIFLAKFKFELIHNGI